MKTISVLATMLFAGSLYAQQPSIGDLGRAERKRQEELTSSKVVQKIGDKKEAPVAEAPKPVQPAAAPDAKAEVAKMEQDMADQRVDLMKKRSTLLLKLNDVIHDKEAVADLEQQLLELQNRAAEMKMERLAKLEDKKTK